MSDGRFLLKNVPLNVLNAFVPNFVAEQRNREVVAERVTNAAKWGPVEKHIAEEISRKAEEEEKRKEELAALAAGAATAAQAGAGAAQAAKGKGAATKKDKEKEKEEAAAAAAAANASPTQNQYGVTIPPPALISPLERCFLIVGNRNLVSISLKHNPYGLKGGLAIKKLIEVNDTLAKIQVDGVEEAGGQLRGETGVHVCPYPPEMMQKNGHSASEVADGGSETGATSDTASMDSHGQKNVPSVPSPPLSYGLKSHNSHSSSNNAYGSMGGYAGHGGSTSGGGEDVNYSVLLCEQMARALEVEAGEYVLDEDDTAVDLPFIYTSADDTASLSHTSSISSSGSPSTSPSTSPLASPSVRDPSPGIKTLHLPSSSTNPPTVGDIDRDPLLSDAEKLERKKERYINFCEGEEHWPSRAGDMKETRKANALIRKSLKRKWPTVYE